MPAIENSPKRVPVPTMTTAMTLTEMWYEGVHLRKAQCAGPTFEEVMDAVGRMDGKSRSFMTLTDSDRSLEIGGGGPSYVVQLCRLRHGGAQILTRTDIGSARKIKVVTGGQGCLFPMYQCCRERDVKEVVGWFMSGETLSDHLEWADS